MDETAASWIAASRRAVGMSRADLADAIGESYHWVRNRETGRTVVAVEDARRIARACGLGDAGWQALRKGVPA